MGKKFLVTGAGGFIGTALCRHLDSINASWTGAGRQDFDDIRNILKHRKPQVIIHLAGGRAADPSTMVTANVLTTIELLEAIRSIPRYHPRVVVAGSAAEYGHRPQGRPIAENSPVQPDSLYGWAKLMATQAALHYARLGQDVVVARLFNILGPETPEGMAAGKFARQIVALEKSSENFTVADLRGTRDFLDIRDIAEALYALSLKGKSGEIYNICSQKKVVMRELLSAMIAVSQKPSMKYKEDKRMKPGVLYAVGSNAKFRRLCPWRPKYDLEQSIKDTLDYYRT